MCTGLKLTHPGQKVPKIELAEKDDPADLWNTIVPSDVLISNPIYAVELPRTFTTMLTETDLLKVYLFGPETSTPLVVRLKV